MSTYTPDRWELLKVNAADGDVIFKVLAGWYGGFAEADRWKISSGISKVVEHDDRYELLQYSGSSYVCYKGARGTSTLSMSTYLYYRDALAASGKASIELLEDTSPTDLKLEN